MKLLKGKTAIITGASRGIGSGIATVFAQQGADVAFTYSSSSEAAESLQKSLQLHGTKVKAYQSNAADFVAAQELAAKVLEEFGQIDILVNNAGITKDNLLMRMGEEDFDKVKLYIQYDIELPFSFYEFDLVDKKIAEQKPQEEKVKLTKTQTFSTEENYYALVIGNNLLPVPPARIIPFLFEFVIKDISLSIYNIKI